MPHRSCRKTNRVPAKTNPTTYQIPVTKSPRSTRAGVGGRAARVNVYVAWSTAGLP